ncbi:MAG: rhizopine catabolism protein, partial [Geminicoccaceae bacterium]|nr:rhizopine catabolism protein [Geminicoccaceae bacterium]
MQERLEAIDATTAAERRALLGLAARSDRRGLAQLALHLVALLATGTALALARGSPWLAPALLLHGLVLVFLFAPLHETIHRTAFRSRRLNDAVARAAGAI